MPYPRPLTDSSVRPAVDPARLTVLTAPAAEPWTVAGDEVALHFRRDSDASDDDYVTALLKAARLHVERATGLAMVNTALRATFDFIPTRRDLALPRAPLVSVQAVSYLDADGAAQTFSSANYTIANAGAAGCWGRLVLKPSADWPDAGDIAGAFSVDFTAGFGSAATDVPLDLRLTVLWLAAWWYEQRLPVNVGNIVNDVPHHLTDLMAAHRVQFLA